MNYEILIVLAIVVGMGLVSKLIAAFIVARKNISVAKAKVIAKMFTFNPLTIFEKFFN